MGGGSRCALRRVPTSQTAAVLLASVATFAFGAIAASAVRLAYEPMSMPVAHIDSPASPAYQVLFVGANRVMLAVR